jgi:pectate disaccharide-lyase
LQLGRASSSYTSISQWPSYNLILNCDSYDNADATGENADGFACKLTTGNGNVFRGCISHNNSDDGWDLFTKTETGAIGPVTIEDCIAYNNGMLSNGTVPSSGDGNGFKLGGDKIAVNHIVRRCIAFNNKKHGFTHNSNSGSIQISNCTSWHNSMSSPTIQGSSDYNFEFDPEGSHQYTNNLSFESGGSDHLGSGTDVQNSNVWWINKKSTNAKNPPLVVAANDFVSLTPPVTFTRNADGSINYGAFLQLASGSDLIGKGINGYDIGARGNVGTEIVAMP